MCQHQPGLHNRCKGAEDATPIMPDRGVTRTGESPAVMSYRATAWAYDLPLAGSQKFVLVALADMADEAASCYPGQERLAQMTGLSVRTVRRSIEQLEAEGLISRQPRYSANGHRTSDRYFLALDVQALPDMVTGGQIDQRSSVQGLPDMVSTTTGHGDRVTIRRTTREPSGGREAPDPALSPTCNRHPDGTDRPCTACRKAREAFEAAEATPVRRISPYADRTVYCEHGQLVNQCWVCDIEAERAKAILHERFGA